MGRERTYWLCQLLGWGGFLAANGSLVFLVGRFAWSWALAFLIVCLAGLGFTHALRGYIRNRHWVELPLRPLVPRVLAASVAVSAAMTAVHFVCEFYLVDVEVPEYQDVPVVAILGSTLVFWTGIVFGWLLIYFGAHYIENLERARAEKWQLQAAVREAELKALKSQLDPHFMFNCLNSIRALITDDPDGAQRMVTQLAALLRYSLQTGGSTVALEQELATVRTYLTLESIRLEERLQFEIDVDECALSVPVPPMVVQTLVENAIKHGIATLPGGGRIRVSSELANGRLHVRVVNTGSLDREGSTGGVGLSNALERIRLLYGDRGSLNLTASSDHTVVADLEIPAAPMARSAREDDR